MILLQVLMLAVVEVAGMEVPSSNGSSVAAGVVGGPRKRKSLALDGNHSAVMCVWTCGPPWMAGSAHHEHM